MTGLGCGYVLLSLVLGHGSFDDTGHGATEGAGAAGGAHETHMAYGVHSDGHGAAESGAGAAHAFHFPFFSPLALATLFAGIGAWGLIAQQGFGASDVVSLVVAFPAAVLTSYLVTYGAWKLASSSSGSSQIRPEDLQGVAAEVITPIPAGGLGEVAAMVRGQRFSGPAREVGGKAVPRGAQVRVRSLVGATLMVEQKEG